MELKNILNIARSNVGGEIANNLGCILADIISNHILKNDIDVGLFLSSGGNVDGIVPLVLGELNGYNNILIEMNNISLNKIKIMIDEVSSRTHNSKINEIQSTYVTNISDIRKDFKKGLFEIMNLYNNEMYLYERMKHGLKVLCRDYVNRMFGVFEGVDRQYTSLSYIFNFK